MENIRNKPRPEIMFEENRDDFNKLAEGGKVINLSLHNLSGLDLRGFNLERVNLSGAYLRGTNISGASLEHANLDGASIKGANISGCLFPYDIPAEEIRLSLDMGTRIRHRKK